MHETSPSQGGRQTPLTRALDTVRSLRQQLAEQRGNQPVAIIGAGLRLPGGIDTLDAYWTALAEGRDLVRPMPEHRKGPFADAWRGLPQRGGFLDEVLDFDAGFFGISPREARHLDPQHRLLLEVAWEALEHAAVPAGTLAEARAGLYLGVMWQDYREWCEGEPDAYWATGNGHNFAAGRVAYALGLTGPTMTVDTACSSSLVAVHLAVQALRRGECELAFAAGANLIMSPQTMRLVQETRSLSPDGLCKTFDSRANGFTRGEGVGAVLLKRLDHALRDGDRVLGVIRGTSVNQDGRSSGFTAPNVLAQVSLIEAALADAGLEPDAVGYAETHGTGTPLGDPIEMDALATALGRRNGGAPLPVGALKTNFGHLEGTAGVAGLIKAMLCVSRRQVPPVVHFRHLNPRIDLSGTGMTVPDTLGEWSPLSGDCASVSSFGMSGTNAHAIVGPLSAEEAPARPDDGSAPVTVTGFAVSARTEEALRARAAQYAGALEALPAADYPAFAHTATAGRTPMDVHATVTAADPRSAAEALRALAAGRTVPEVAVTEGGGAPDVAGPDLPRRVVDLPPYPWQRSRFAPPTRAAGPGAATAGREDTAPAAPAVPLVHEVAWRPQAPSAAPAARSVVLAGDDEDLLVALAGRAAARGLTGTVLAPSATDLPDGWRHARLPADAAAWAGTWAAGQDTTGEAGVPLVLALRATPLPGSDGAPDTASDPAEPGAALCAAVTTAVAAAARAGSHRVFALTRAACRTRPQDTTAATDHGLLHGLGPVLGLELAAGWGGVVDLPADPGGADLDALLSFVAGESDAAARGEAAEDRAAVRDGAVLTARLVENTAPTEPLRVVPEATYVVTGGLGGVGRELTSELVARGARHLLLIGRRSREDLAPEARELLDGLAAAGVEAVYRPGGCDTPQAVATACSALEAMPPVRGVLHAAGVLDRVPAAEAGAAHFADALRGKFAGAWLLHRASLDWPLDFFAMISSVSAVWGTDRCAGYAAANGGLDALVAHRAGRGLPAVSIAYGPWDLGESGMADSASRDTFARLGVGALDAAAGRAALAASPAVSGHVVVCPLDMPRFRSVMSRFRARGLFSADLPDPVRDEPVAAVREPSVVAGLAAVPERARPAAARVHVARIVAAQLGFESAAAVKDDTGFFDLGLDSIMAVDLVARLGQAFEVSLRAADVFDHPTVARMAEYLLTDAPQSAPAPETATPAPGQRPAPATTPNGTPAATTTPYDTPAATTTPNGTPAATTTPYDTPAPAATPYDEAPGEPPSTAHEPIAIVGMAGRFPQADSVEDLWTLLREARDAVGPVPEGRYDTAAFHGDDVPESGRITTDQGGFLTDIERFDAGFFGIPGREAENLDPQQRLLLESAWHALEDAGTDPHALRGSRTGVFVGISYADYARVLAGTGAEHLDAYYSTGTSLNAAAGRLAYTLGLNGPAMAVDTACSSSLVALHLAVRSLRGGESDTVLAGGVNIILDPMASVSASRAHMLSPDGRCRTFSADANGFVRAEGCGVLVLKRLTDARRDGDRVLAVIRGTAVNQDGASSGLTAPSGTAQRALLADALADARVTGSQVSYLEAHGTGTALGDPIELGAAWHVLGPDRKPGEPLHIGSVKSNIGHCESAAGMAAVFKTVLALRHDLIPANLHFAAPNPHVDWAEMNVRVVDTPTPWRSGAVPRVAGVSGFGLTGTNAHVVLADAPAGAPAATSGAPAGTPHLVPLSAPDAAGLERLSASWHERLTAAGDEELAGLAATASAGRAHFPHRRALLGDTRDKLLAQLAAPLANRRTTGRPRIAFLFSGQGSQRFGMGRELYETEPVFREVFDRCDRELAPVLGGSLVELVLYGDDPKAVDETRVTQPALFALESALAALWESWGVTPDVVMGHSVGEVAAAVHAGVTDLSSGLRLIARRAELMQGTRRGAMLAVRASEQQVRALLADTPLDIAAVNAPDATVVAGAPEDIERFAARITEDGVRGVRLTVSHAFHSRLLDPVLPRLRETAAALDLTDPGIPLISNLTGTLAEPGTFDAEYWVRHARNPVRFHDGARRLAEQKVDVCLEIGPDGTLVNLVRAGGSVPAGTLLPSLRRGTGDRAALAAAAKELYELGQDIDWAAVQAPRRTPRAAAPLYPFAATPYWRGAGRAGTPVPASAAPEDGRPVPAAAPAGPPWGTELRSPAIQGRVFVTERSTVYPPHLDDHRLFGTVQVAGASQTATVLSALGRDGDRVVLEDLHFPRALVLHDGERYELQIIERDGERGARTVSVQSLLDPERHLWQEHLTARRIPADPAGHRTAPDPREFIAHADRHLGGEAFYRHLRGIGYLLGPSFSWVGDAWIRGDEALIRFDWPEKMNEPAEDYQIHPGLLDSCLQSSVCFAIHEDDAEPLDQEKALVIPFAAARVSFPGRPVPGRPLWGHVRAELRETADDRFHQVETADLHLFDESGATVLAMDGFRFRTASRAVLQSSLRQGTRHTWDLAWTELPAPAATDPAATRQRTVAVVGAATPAGKLLIRAAEGAGHHTLAADAQVPLARTPDLIVDARFLTADAPAGAHAVTEAVLDLAAVLRSVPQDVPYAVPVAGSTPHAPLREALWGLLAGVEAEESERRLLRVTLADGWDAPGLLNALDRILDDGTVETRLEIGPGRTRTARLVPATAPADTTADGLSGAALVTGGLGGLGLSTAAVLARNGCAAVTLMARSEPDPETRRLIEEITAAGTPVHVVRGDVTDPADCARAVARAGAVHPLRLVLHLAGATDDRAFGRVDRGAAERVFAAKAHGADVLAEALRGHDLDAFVLFSSASSVLGSAGQTTYAAANGYLTGLAETLRAEGVPATSIAWGPWVPDGKGGMAASEAVRRATTRLGIGTFTDEAAEALLLAALTARQARVIAVDLAPDTFTEALGGHPRARLLEAPAGGDGHGARRPHADPSGRPRGWFGAHLAALDPGERDAALRHFVREAAGETLGQPAALDEETTFGDMGLDSIMVIDLRTRLSQSLGVDLLATVALDHPTVPRLADHILGLLHPEPARPAGPGRPDRPETPDQAEAAGLPDLAELSFEELVQAVHSDVSQKGDRQA
ncbi:SDR family NAD(P)-dependent oxidoreductase [Streptomyces sp. HO565]|uniref:SDR family NAD(P)-dependent oxidoreductase n=1 Tax=Streptomyces sp. HO565 TaxID=2857489 RepID=UPI0034DCA565